jgi:PPM family protein phosphatase
VTALRGAAVTDVGRVRSVNQDGALTSAFLAAVADGMGGHRAGEVASAVALRSLAGHDHFGSAGDLVDAVQQANGAIFRRAAGRPGLRGMGTTLCALALVRGEPDEGTERLAVVNVGDSRAYHLRDGDLVQLTIDHSLVQMMVREGKLRPEEAANHPQRNIVLRALGIESHVDVDHWELDAVVGDRYLVCSDGLFNEVSQGRMAATLRTYAEPAEAAKVLVALANAGGGRDNITCVVVDVVDDVDVDDDLDGEGADGDGDDVARDETVAGGDDVARDETVAGQDGVGDGGPATTPGGVPGTDGGRSGEALAVGGSDKASRRAGRGSSLLDDPAQEGAATVERRGTTVLTSVSLEELAAGGPLGATPGDETDELRAHRPRRITFRVVAFFLVVVVVLAVAALAVGWYATRTYFVAFEGDQVVIYEGRPGGLLWIEPTVAEPAAPSLDRAALVGALCDRVEGQPSATSLSSARAIVEQLRRDAAELGVPRTPCGGSS